MPRSSTVKSIGPASIWAAAMPKASEFGEKLALKTRFASAALAEKPITFETVAVTGVSAAIILVFSFHVAPEYEIDRDVF